MRVSNIPNLICLARIVLVIPIVRSLWQEQFLLSLLLIIIAGLSDILDGYLAKKKQLAQLFRGCTGPSGRQNIIGFTFPYSAKHGLDSPMVNFDSYC